MASNALLQRSHLERRDPGRVDLQIKQNLPITRSGKLAIIAAQHDEPQALVGNPDCCSTVHAIAFRLYPNGQKEKVQ
ncbi:hypothetical protein [Nitrogeniibacter aestuarii]|uniref:hypothetical protein n=1 Tax=Nitrogeniibacter aestuarii TaxID=2815343 RepID=UPI001D1301D7|nr:hypothetical protein [Nitrogeniibacter aestuarii]